MNRLSQTTSPYLLQHANNPVDWYPWGAEALEKAKAENKLILVSIGYSACHWCHVMEHESFEDEGVAAVMNEHFVCIKVDREERPDVDQIYMSAVQLMTGRGGWPLNCFCLPDQRPIYGGTYFRKNDWVSLLFNLTDFYKQKPEEAEEYAVKLTEGIRQYESIEFVASQPEYTKADIEAIVANWQRHFDKKEGGMGSSPKFPMPNNWQFLMRYAHLFKNEEVAGMVKLTLEKMAYGGIYDHIGGGFARYSVDNRWHVPHFEKMLYDNAQLLALYAEGYTWTPDKLYPKVAAEIVDFIERELTSPQNGFYAALDADSEGVEGKFYTFTKPEIIGLLGGDAELFCIYYHVTDDGNWHEEATNVFFRRESDEVIASKLGLSVASLLDRIDACRKKIFDERAKRIRPGLDNKVIASWNGLMLKGLCEAYRAFAKPNYLELALKNADFILAHLIDETGRLKRIFSPAASEISQPAFLDDYANVADAFIALYEITFDEKWLNQASQLVDIAIRHYYDPKAGIFYFTADDDLQLIARKSEIMDGVIPSSNSVMARNLKKLGLFFDHEPYLDIAAQLLRNVVSQIARYGSSYSNWCMLLLDEVFGMYEIAVTGGEAQTMRAEMEKIYIPNKIILGGSEGSLPLLTDKFGSSTRIFVCKDKTCGLPADNVDAALKQIAN
jgi:uncharacterized protein YyaL (SSP411 family)